MIRRALLVPAAVLVLFALLMASCRREEQKVSPATFPSAPVILISVDTLRADHLPAYGYRKVDTPNIDLLRKDSVLFRNAYAHVPLTLPSHATVLSGLLPPENGVRDNIGYRFDGSKHASIPSFLKQQGYATGAAVSSYVLRSASGLGSLFDFYDDHFDASTDGSAGNLQRAGSQTSAVAERWIDEQGRAPFFFFLHLFEPHSPYDPPEPFRSRFALPYDGEIAAADAVLGEFIQHLKDREIYDRAIVIFISDHGEDLYEHGEPEHGIFLYRDVLHVPLLVKLPGGRRAGETIDRSSGLVDIFPSICALTGFPPPERLSGRNFLGPATTAEGPRTIYAETFYPRIHLGWSELRSLIGERFHLISAPTPELYDLAADPAEKKNITSEERRQFAIMKEDLGQYGALLQSPLQADPEDEKKLAALGYIGSRQKSDTGPLPDPKEHVGEIAPMLQSMRMLDLGRIPEAIAGLRAIVKRNPGYTDAWSQLGRALETVGDYEDAVTAYETAVR
ncbi:MAG: sulfatase-like hydrolase/transferase, partial [Acidobacteriota bacterium]